MIKRLFCLFLLAASASCLRAQTYSIDWFTIDGGGGTSTGGVYSVTGTIGQPDAGGPMTGGNYSLIDGFWALSAVQSPGAPILGIKLTSTNTVMVYWPSPATGFSPQVATGFPTANWLSPVEAVHDNGT